MKSGVLCVAIVALLGLIVISVWSGRRMLPGCPSEVNYDRVKNGMSIGEVVAALGPGEEIPKNQLPGPMQKRPDSPPGEYGLVWGDRVFRWRDGEDTILVGFSGERVTSKFRWWEHAW